MRRDPWRKIVDEYIEATQEDSLAIITLSTGQTVTGRITVHQGWWVINEDAGERTIINGAHIVAVQLVDSEATTCPPLHDGSRWEGA